MNDNGHPDFSEILLGLKALQKDLDRQEQEAQAALDAVKNERRSIDQMIRAAEGTGKYQKRGGYKPKSKTADPLTLDRLRETIATHKDEVEDIPGSFTANGLVKETGLHLSTVRKALMTLRENGEVRLAGERQLGESGRASMIFVADGQ